MIKVSTIILTYNSKNYIRPCLEALFFAQEKNHKQSPKISLSAIIVDNNSPDGTGSYIENLLRLNLNRLGIKFIKSPENNGFAAGINIGIREALKDNSDYIFLLNPDTKILPGAVEKMISGFKFKASSFTKIGIVGAEMLYPDGTPQGTFGYFPSFFTEFLQRTRLYKIFPFGRFIPYNRFSKKYFRTIHPVDWISGGAMMISREVIEKIGLFDENYFMYIEDIDFCRRAREAGFEIIYNPEAKIWHKLQASLEVKSKTKNQKSKFWNFFDVFLKRRGKANIWQKESLAYYFKKWKSGFSETVCRNTKYHLEPAGYAKLDFILQNLTLENSFKVQSRKKSVLDVGCGNGNIAFVLAALGCNVTGIDVNKDIIQKLKIKNQNFGFSNINFIATDANSPGILKEKKFDMIIMSEILEHLKNPLKTLRAVKTLLNEGGIVIVTIPNRFSFEERIRKFILKNNYLSGIKQKIKNRNSNASIQSSYDTPHLHFFSYDDFIKLAEKAGFNIIKSKAQSAGFKSFYYTIGRFLLSRKSPWFHRFDRIDRFLARFIPTQFGDGMMFLLKTEARNIKHKTCTNEKT